MASASNSPGSGPEAQAASNPEEKKKKKPKKAIPQVTYSGAAFEYVDDDGELVKRFLDDEEKVLVAKLLDPLP